jgi:hypothetical protein
MRAACVVFIGLVACSGQRAREPHKPKPIQRSAAPIALSYAGHLFRSSRTDGYAQTLYAPAYTFAQICRSAADCGDHMSCRAREDGAQVCMGYGSPGESCWFGGDCISGSCDSRDGRKTCR